MTETRRPSKIVFTSFELNRLKEIQILLGKEGVELVRKGNEKPFKKEPVEKKAKKPFEKKSKKLYKPPEPVEKEPELVVEEVEEPKPAKIQAGEQQTVIVWHIFRGWGNPCTLDIFCSECHHHSHKIPIEQYKEMFGNKREREVQRRSEPRRRYRQRKQKELPRRPGDTGKFCMDCRLNNHNTTECYWKWKRCFHCKATDHLIRSCPYIMEK